VAEVGTMAEEEEVAPEARAGAEEQRQRVGGARRGRGAAPEVGAAAAPVLQLEMEEEVEILVASQYLGIYRSPICRGGWGPGPPLQIFFQIIEKIKLIQIK